MKNAGICKLEIEIRVVKERRVGRPKATEKTLADYACSGVDAARLKEALAERLRQTMGSAADVALLEKTLIGENQIVGPIPYKVLKAEFGELVRCSRAGLNRYERLFEIR